MEEKGTGGARSGGLGGGGWMWEEAGAGPGKEDGGWWSCECIGSGGIVVGIIEQLAGWFKDMTCKINSDGLLIGDNDLQFWCF